MKVNAENDRNSLLTKSQAPFPMFKMTNDPRFVGFGKILSRSGLDELPQLLNILKGEMSFIGPRPLPIMESKLLPKSWDFRYMVKPGILSEWAISRKKHESLETWKELEKKTLKYGSTVNDVSVLVRALLFLIRSS